jgi:maternal embryonic leucine zipper kinase
MKAIPEQVGHFIIKDQINSGGFGVCHFAEDTKTHQRCCVKIVPHFDEYKLEFEILSKISHPNIVSLIEVEEFDDFYFIFMELCEGLTLFNLLKIYAPLPENDAKYFFEQLVSALEYLHLNGISHGDIKLTNMICSHDMRIKLIDFGFASEVDIQTEYRGNVNYSAPEILSFTPFNGKMADMWSAGVCLFAMVAGCFPFYERDVDDAIRRVENVDFKIPEFISTETKWMISSLLQYHPESRLTASEVLMNEWFISADEIIYVDQSIDNEPNIPTEIEC